MKKLNDLLARIPEMQARAKQRAEREPLPGKPLPKNVVQAASDAEGSMRNAGAWFAWKWVAVAAGGLVGVCLVAYASLAWQLHQVSSLREEKAALLGEVAQLQANADDWAKRGGRAKLEKCGDAGRLCVRIDKTTGYGKDSDYFVLRGY